jgi:hypothetical protein
MASEANLMTSNRTWIRMAGLCGVVAVLVALTAAAGVFLRGSGASAPTVSLRGEAFQYATDGVYRFNAERTVAEGVGWDIFTLTFAVPGLLLSLPWLARGSMRARLFALGLLAYFFYQYLMYAVTWAFGPLFLPFVADYALSLIAVVWIVSTIELRSLAEHATERFPRRSMAILCFVLALALVGMWLRRIAAGLSGDLGGAMLLGQTTMVVQALDLGLIVPLAAFTGVTAWRGQPIGYLLSSVVVVKAVAMTSAICAMLLSAWAVEGHLALGGFTFFAAAALASCWLGIRMYRSI